MWEFGTGRKVIGESVVGFALVGGLTLLALGVAPYRLRVLLREDGLVETASAVLFALAAAAALFVVLSRRGLPGADREVGFSARWAAALLAVVGGLAFLSEISFGARLFGFSMPAMAGGGELDGPQDFLLLARRWSETQTLAVSTLWGLAAASLVAAGAWSVRRRTWVRAPVRAVVQFRPLYMALACLLAATVLDVFETPTTQVFEECLEFAAAVLMMFAALSLVHAR